MDGKRKGSIYRREQKGDELIEEMKNMTEEELDRCETQHAFTFSMYSPVSDKLPTSSSFKESLDICEKEHPVPFSMSPPVLSQEETSE